VQERQARKMIHQDTQHGITFNVNQYASAKKKSNVGFNFPENKQQYEINKMIILIALHPSIIGRHL
jgi:hypothetical protein